MRSAATAHLWTPIFMDRGISTEGALDPAGFFPFADVIGGSRWPGQSGGPKVSGMEQAA